MIVRFYLSEERAIECVTEAIKEVWEKKPTMINIRLKGSVDEIPMLHVEYECYAFGGGGYDIEVGEEYEEET